MKYDELIGKICVLKQPKDVFVNSMWSKRASRGDFIVLISVHEAVGFSNAQALTAHGICQIFLYSFDLAPI